ncbi:stealth family protein [Erysipelothrix urinaevulpis]|uniref:stealth family protein n=1 Tax=Erysipelothrix urinaevulpis TaxID=2683717 RepID=UPI00135C701C|nr:stealth family protein [Erysipelothrix urinaevulpis]
MNKIDFVIPWVNGNDIEWQKEKEQYSPNKGTDVGAVRYRDMDNLVYFFRGVDKFTPWVNKIYFVTWGHIPDFLDINHPKLEIINHKDYIPEEYLPTFSSHPIELNFHRIPNLSEQFVYFNDDMFIFDKMEPTDFFENGLPKDQLELDYITSDKGTIFPHILLNNIDLLNQNYNKKQVMKTHRKKWYSSKYDLKTRIKNYYFGKLGNFSGIKWHHLPAPYLKTTLEHVWEKNYEVLHKTCLNKFRSASDVNQYVFRNEQFVTGQFEPTNLNKLGKFYNMPHLKEQLRIDLKNNKYKMYCVNDSAEIEDFDPLKDEVNSYLNEVLPDKSSFEL